MTLRSIALVLLSMMLAGCSLSNDLYDARARERAVKEARELAEQQTRERSENREARRMLRAQIRDIMTAAYDQGWIAALSESDLTAAAVDQRRPDYVRELVSVWKERADSTDEQWLHAYRTLPMKCGHILNTYYQIVSSQAGVCYGQGMHACLARQEPVPAGGRTLVQVRATMIELSVEAAEKRLSGARQRRP